MCNATTSSGESSVMAMEMDVVVVVVVVVVVANLDLHFGALEGSYCSRYPIKSYIKF